MDIAITDTFAVFCLGRHGKQA